MNTYSLVILSLILFLKLGFSQTNAPIIQSQKIMDGIGTDIAQNMVQHRDDGNIITENKTSTDGDFSGYHSFFASAEALDSWIVKLKSNCLVNNIKNENSSASPNQAIRLENESAEDFVKRAFKATDLVPPTIEANIWNTEKKEILYFENFKSEDKMFNLGFIGYLLYPLNENKYERILVDTLSTQTDGEYFNKIDHVFTANVKNDFLPELIISTKWSAHSPRFSEVFDEGYYYDVNIYKHPNMDNPEKRLMRNKKLGNKLSGFDGFTYNRTTNKKIIKTDKFKGMAAIRLALSQMSF